ncbi:MAG: hypothetical protein Q9183_007794, partial [Haloplaca sp. 2 TL-2023]
IFESLRKQDDGKAQEEKTRLVNEREEELYRKQQRRLSELVCAFCNFDAVCRGDDEL